VPLKTSLRARELGEPYIDNYLAGTQTGLTSLGGALAKITVRQDLFSSDVLPVWDKAATVVQAQSHRGTRVLRAKHRNR
jgi:hypothetical protein